jgi:DNA repair exonuclease SbcCD ATPase subunit
MSLKTEAKLSLLLACAGLFACTPAAKVEQAQEEQQKVAAEATEKRAELNRVQRDEAAELIQEQRKARAEIDQNARAENIDQQKEAVKVGTDQIQERAKVEQDIAKDTAEANGELAKASAELDQKRTEVQGRSRERLQKIDARANTLSSRTQTAEPGEKVQATQAMTGFPEARATAERDIEALSSVTAANLKRAEKAVDGELAKLEKKLDRVEDKL